MALFEQDLRMIGVLDILTPIEAAHVTGDELVLMVQTEPIGVRFDGEQLSGIARGYRVAIGVEDDAELTRGAQA